MLHSSMTKEVIQKLGIMQEKRLVLIECKCHGEQINVFLRHCLVFFKSSYEFKE